jgi:hypothetical protein
MSANDSTSNLSLSDAAAAQDFSESEAASLVGGCAEKTWVGIELLDGDGNPIADEPYKLMLPDGSIREGKTDSKGTAGASGIDPGSCKVCFPRLDGRLWRGL